MEKSHQQKRRKRVRRLKRLIVGSILAAIIVPTVFCFLLLARVHTLERRLETLSAAYEYIRYDYKSILTIEDPEEEEEVHEPEIEKESVHTQQKQKVYLTFDDGPSSNTEQILDILDEYGVKATFFVTGEEAQSHPERYLEIVNRGHTLGMHSYSHRYGDIYQSEESFATDLKTLQDFLYDTTGVRSKYYRFPGGSSNTVSKVSMDVFCDYLTKEGITYFDWNVSAQDASGRFLKKEEIVSNCIEGMKQHESAVILLHDSYAKESTIEALPEIIETIQAMDDTELLPITEDTVAVQHRSSN